MTRTDLGLKESWSKYRAICRCVTFHLGSILHCKYTKYVCFNHEYLSVSLIFSLALPTVGFKQVDAQNLVEESKQHRGIA